MDIPNLPIIQALPQLKEAISKGHAVLTAPPGSGKTTVVPLALLHEVWLGNKKIIMLQPRRVAARAACFRMASLLHEEPGHTVGYHIRLDRMTGAKTRIEVVTEGILTRRIQNDPELPGVGLIIFDEFHERSLHADLALALCLDLCQIVDTIKILVMSATLDTGPVSHLLGGAPVIKAKGRCHEVEIDYHLPAHENRIADSVASGVVRVLRQRSGDILAFLPGVGEIVATERTLRRSQECKDISIQPLYGNLSGKEQDAILYPQNRDLRRVVLATSIAETSLTIEGIANVVDSGWSRRPYFNPANGLTTLQTIRVSKSAADQRAGRAGRLGPGYCLRLWNTSTHHSLPPFHPPEIVTSDLSYLILEILQWGVTGPDDLLWLDPPRSSSYEKAFALLQDLGALDQENNLTILGKKLAQLPLHPRLGRLLLQAEQAGKLQKGADICALLTERDVMDFRDTPSAEISLRLELLKTFRTKDPSGASQAGGRPDLLRRVKQTANSYRRLFPSSSREQNNFSTASLLISAYPDRIGKRLENQFGKYLLANGRLARLPASDPLCHSEYLVVANMDAGKKEGRIYLAEPVDLEMLRANHPALIQSRSSVSWNQENGKIDCLARQAIGAITLQEQQLQNVEEELVTETLIEGLHKNGLQLLAWNKKTVHLQARVRILSELQPRTPWPDLTYAHLEKNLDWLRPYLHAIRNISGLKKLDLHKILLAQLDYSLQQKLQRDAPEHFLVPSGSAIRITYAEDTPPILAVRMQELFGCTKNPAICGGKVPLLLHLLSPAGRPVQVTSDLEGFWKSSYHEVKKDLKGRYPKHFWPDDPAGARATKTTRKNMQRAS